MFLCVANIKRLKIARFPEISLTSYSKAISSICSLHYHCYAGDTQVYVCIMPKEAWLDASTKLEACLVDISTWSANVLNEVNTELIIFKPKHQFKVSNKIQL